MLSSKEIIDFLKENKPFLQDNFHLTKVGLFGSYARQEQTESSDIDLIVEFKESTQNLYDLKQAIKRVIKDVFGKDVDICREKYIKPYYKDQILKDAIFV